MEVSRQVKSDKVSPVLSLKIQGQYHEEVWKIPPGLPFAKGRKRVGALCQRGNINRLFSW